MPRSQDGEFRSPDDDLAARHGAVLRVDAPVNLQSRSGAQLSTSSRPRPTSTRPKDFPASGNGTTRAVTGYAGREIFATLGPASARAWQATAWNPSITRVKSEDTVLVTPDGRSVPHTDGPQVRVEHPAGSPARPGAAAKRG
jgi:hypothetical protein